jgi:hypothetical protein
MELTGGADYGALGGDEKSEWKVERLASGGSVQVERWVRRAIKLVPCENTERMDGVIWPSISQLQC